MKKLLENCKRDLDLIRDQIKVGINTRWFKIQLFKRNECCKTFISEINGEIKLRDNTTYKGRQLPKHVDDWLIDYMKRQLELRK